MKYNLEKRNCPKAACGKPFFVLETSPQKYCCLEHNPKPQNTLAAIRERQKRGNKANKAGMIALCEESIAKGWSRKEAVAEGRARKLTTPSGQPLTVSYLNNFMFFNGYSKKRPVKTRKIRKVSVIGVLETVHG